MGYTPLFDTLLNGTMFGCWPHNGIFALLLSRASREGVINEVPESLAAHIGIPVDKLMESINYFMQPDPGSRSADNDGRRLELIDPARPWGWRVVNHAKYREKARKRNYDEKRTESGIDAERKREERAAAKGIPTCPDASREVPLSSPSPTPSPLLKRPTDVGRDEEAQAPALSYEEVWPRVQAALGNPDLQKSFPADGLVQRAIRQIGGWYALGQRKRDMRGKTQVEFKRAYNELLEQMGRAA